jgi:hypothetical protein
MTICGRRRRFVPDVKFVSVGRNVRETNFFVVTHYAPL